MEYGGRENANCLVSQLFNFSFSRTALSSKQEAGKSVEWGLVFPDANGEYQSPINLNSREARYDPSLLEVRLSPNYVVCRDCEVTNDGHTIQVILKSKSVLLTSTHRCACKQFCPVSVSAPAAALSPPNVRRKSSQQNISKRREDTKQSKMTELLEGWRAEEGQEGP
ncbi:hypothetical protein CB1_000844022 [Camelus ferus]|nr:hypothetical protein CB1_000844022 [Camelus ferus]